VVDVNERGRGAAGGVASTPWRAGARVRAASALAALSVAAAVTAAACGPSGGAGEAAATPVAPAPSAPEGSKPPPASQSSPDVARDTHVALLDPGVLASLEPRGFTLGKLVDGSEATSAEDLARTSLGVVLDELAADVRATIAEHPTARVSSVLGTRLFEASWLRSKEMRFELAGVFNRLDRKAFYEGTCGEVRFLFRLAYVTQQAGAPMHGRLPLTINVVFLVPEEPDAKAPCKAVAQAWRAPAGLDEAKAAAWLVDEGALSSVRRAKWTLKAVEANLQTVRVQSTAHPSMGGHAEYSLRVFNPTVPDRTSSNPSAGTPRKLVAGPMENLPDVARLGREPALRDELVRFLRDPEVLRGIDAGVLRMPDRFLVQRGRSVSPRGLDRVANRPFRQILRDADLAGLDLASYRTIRSAKALVRRLDGLGCAGCHQSRTLAGFHHVGNDAKSEPAWSSLVMGSSPHLLADLDRRRAYVDAIASGAPPDDHRPSAERQGHDGGFGAPCGLGDPGFAAWTCKQGLRCEKLEDLDVGVCLDERPVGAPCEPGDHVFDGRTPVGDRVAGIARRSCGAELGCSPNISGFPLGACAGSCQAKDAAGQCIDFVDIDGFQACLRVNHDAADCARRYVVERIDRACDAKNPCRQDFVCARTDDPDHGACIPPYFVFPLRLDGYPLRR
jgi:hypothetical protein